jgi:hypothetical protein
MINTSGHNWAATWGKFDKKRESQLKKGSRKWYAGSREYCEK